MERKLYILISILCIFTISFISSQKPPYFQEEKNISQYISSPRYYFLGHKEISDIFNGMVVLSNTVAVYAFVGSPLKPPEKDKLRFYKSKGMIQSLSKYKIGMDPIYSYPSIYYLFIEEDVDSAIEIAQWGLEDSRTTILVDMLAAFIYHHFLRENKKAGEIYLKLPQKYPQANVPLWIVELGEKLIKGEDPYNDPLKAERLEKGLMNSFPHAYKIFEENKKRKGGYTKWLS